MSMLLSINAILVIAANDKKWKFRCLNGGVLPTPSPPSEKFLILVNLHSSLYLKVICYRTKGLLPKLQNLLSRTALKAIYKAFVVPILDYCSVLFDQAFKVSFHEKFESIKYIARLVLAETIRSATKEKFY